MNRHCGLWYAAAILVLGMVAYGSKLATRPLRIVVDANSVLACSGDAVLLQYQYRDVPFKPYVKELFTPSGLNVLLDAPKDHLHHHALMFAVAAEGVNFWEETPTAGRQEHGGFTDMVVAEHGAEPSAGFTELVHWIDSTGREVLTEHRTIEVCQVNKPGATVLTWRSELAVPKGKESLALTGAHYFGLGMRFLRSMDGVGEFCNADGKDGTVFRGEEKLMRSKWCAYTATADGKLVTVAMLGHPVNPRHPTMWFTMNKPFAYLSATLALHEEPLKVTADEPLALRYGVALWDGQVQTEQIDKLYVRWVDWIGKTGRCIYHRER